jgi:hypothetical protein
VSGGSPRASDIIVGCMRRRLRGLFWAFVLSVGGCGSKNALVGAGGSEGGAGGSGADAGAVTGSGGRDASAPGGSGGSDAGAGGSDASARADAGTDAPASMNIYEAWVNRPLDLLFVIENSPGMAPLQIKLVAQLPIFFNVLKGVRASNGIGTALPDMHVAVVSTDTGPGKFDIPASHCRDHHAPGMQDLSPGHGDARLPVSYCSSRKTPCWPALADARSASLFKRPLTSRYHLCGRGESNSHKLAPTRT